MENLLFLCGFRRISLQNLFEKLRKQLFEKIYLFAPFRVSP